jgi:2-dehydropantoate 2-reductase
MLARGGRAEQVRKSGITIRGLADFTVPVPTITDPRELRGADVLIVATKTSGTEQALQPLRGADIGVAFSIQNGLGKNEPLAHAFGAERVLGSLANTSGELLANGDVLFTRNVNVLLGEPGGGDSPRAQRIAGTIDASGVRSTAVPDIVSREWTKFTGWAGLMCLAVTTRAPTWRYLSDPDSAFVLVRLVREVAALAQSLGVELDEVDPLLPLPVILRGSEQEAIEALGQAGRDFKANAPEHRMSALQDLLAGRALEVEETLGYAVRKAAQAKLSLPLLEGFYHLVAAIDRAQRG